MTSTTVRRRSWRKRAFVSLAALVLVLVVVEIALRVRQTSRYGTTFTYYNFEEDPASGLRIPRPGDVVGPIRVSSRGFRSPELETPKPEGRIRIAFLGGSSTFCAEASGNDATWPHLVFEGLVDANPGVELDYVNAGVGGYGTAQSLLNLDHRVAPLEPDVLVVYHATNDLTRESRLLAVEQGLYEIGQDETSWFGGWWLTACLIEKNLKYMTRRRRSTDRPFRFEPRELSAPFEEHLGALVDRCRELAPVVVLVTFSIRARPDQSPAELTDACASSLYYMPFMTPEGLLSAFAEYNRVIREVAATGDVVLVEGEDTIPGDATHFRDSVHMLDPGCRLQAARILDALEAAPTFRSLLESRRGQ